MYKLKPYFLIGFGTLVGNSDEKAETTVDFQAAGVVLDFVYGKKLFAAGGFHLGAIIADVLHKQAEADGEKVHSGTFYKSSGLFLAPHVSVGINRKSHEFRLIFKPVFVFASEDQNKIDGFNASYLGVSYG
ncbi:MAG: hypothetical protein ACE5I1_17300 [bacterium]